MEYIIQSAEVIISRYVIEEEDEELIGEERDVAALMVKTEKDPLSALTLICRVGGPGAQRGGGSGDFKWGLEVTEYTA